MDHVRRFEASFRRILQRKRMFDAAFYLARYPDVRATRMHPFAHYLLHGAAEGRKPNRWFEPLYYLARYQEARNRGGDPFVDYLKYGVKEKASPHPLLDGERGRGFYSEGSQFACDS